MKKIQNVGNLEQKLTMLRRQLTLCLQNFHDPLSFVTQVDSMIQSLRNFTFAVQANKANIPDFDAWYAGWQDLMKQDDYMKWLNATRIDVVHKDILTTESHVLVTLYVDHLMTVYTMHYEIMTPTEDIISAALVEAQAKPELLHSTGIIDRYYIFDIDNKPVDTIHVLKAAYDFLDKLYSDLLRYMNTGTIQEINLSPLKDYIYNAPDALTVRFKLKNGSILRENVIRVDRDENVIEAAKERYGEFNLSHSLKTRSYKEFTRAQFEIAENIFNKDGHHISMMQLHGKKGWSMLSPVFTDRAEKIYFFRRLAEKVKSEGIDKIIYTTEAWTYGDLDKGLKHISSGKEIKSLRNKGEVLETYYIDNKGRFFVIAAPILRTSEHVKLGEKKERKEDHRNVPIFAGIFQAWGLIKDEDETQT